MHKLLLHSKLKMLGEAQSQKIKSPVAMLGIILKQLNLEVEDGMPNQ